MHYIHLAMLEEAYARLFTGSVLVEQSVLRELHSFTTTLNCLNASLFRNLPSLQRSNHLESNKPKTPSAQVSTLQCS